MTTARFREYGNVETEHRGWMFCVYALFDQRFGKWLRWNISFALRRIDVNLRQNFCQRRAVTRRQTSIELDFTLINSLVVLIKPMRVYDWDGVRVVSSVLSVSVRVPFSGARIAA